MKLLKPGVIPAAVTYKATCPQCGAKMEYDADDVHDVGEPGRLWTPPERCGEEIDCCFCGAAIVLKPAAKRIIPMKSGGYHDRHR